MAKDGIGNLIASITNNRLSEGKFSDAEIKNIQNKKSEDETLDIDSEEIIEKETNVRDESAEFPHINDIEINIDCSEAEWIAIYAFYESDFAKKPFTKKAVHERYIAKRKTETRVKNFAANWKSLFKNYFATLNDTEFKFKTSDLSFLKNLIWGKEKGTVRTTSIKKVKKADISEIVESSDNNPNELKEQNTARKVEKRTHAKSVVIDEFDLYKSPDGKKIGLNDFLSQKKPGDSSYDRIVVIAYYITRINKTQYFTEGNIEYAYKALQLGSRPKHLRQTINNIKTSKVWFKDFQESGKWTLERIGEIYVDENLPAQENKK